MNFFKQKHIIYIIIFCSYICILYAMPFVFAITLDENSNLPTSDISEIPTIDSSFETEFVENQLLDSTSAQSDGQSIENTSIHESGATSTPTELPLYSEEESSNASSVGTPSIALPEVTPQPILEQNHLALQSSASTLINQDGISNSGILVGGPMSSKIRQKNFTAFPAGVTNYNYFGGVFDGRYMWMVPNGAKPYVTKVDTNPATEGQMIKYDLSSIAEISFGTWAFSGGTFDGTNVWLTPRNANMLVKINAATGVLSGYTIPSISTLGGNKFLSTIFDGTYIWLIPSDSRELIRADLNGNMTSYNKWPTAFWTANSAKSLFVSAYLVGSDIFMMPAGATQIIKFNTLAAPTDLNSMTTIDYPGGGQYYGCAFDGQYIWMAPWTSGNVLKIDKDTNEVIQVASGIVGGCSGAIYDGESVWFIPYSGRLFKINAATNQMTQYPTFGYSYLGGIYRNSNIWLVSGDAGKVSKIESYHTVSGNITLKGPETSIQGATVTAESSDSVIKQTATTNSSGFYSFDLPLGHYTISVKDSNHAVVAESSASISLSTSDITQNLKLDYATVTTRFQDISGADIANPVVANTLLLAQSFTANALPFRGYKVTSATVNGNNSTLDDSKTTLTVSQATNTVVFVYVGSGESIPPVNPDDPTQALQPMEPGTGENGPLSIDYITPISFGNEVISPSSRAYLANTLKPFVQVSDFRGTGAGWKLQAKLSFFRNGTDTDSLPGAAVHFNNGFSLSENVGFTSPTSVNSVTLHADNFTISNVVIAYAGTGKGTSVARWYSTNIMDSQNNNVTLTIPAGIARVGTHTATITWSLINAP